MVTLLIDNFNLTGQQQTTLSADVAAGATALPVVNNAGFAVNDYVLVESEGSEKAEIRKIASVSGASTITVDALTIAHDSGVTITKAPYNQARVYRSATRTGSYALLSTVALAYDNSHIVYNDSTGTTASWYKVTYYNATTTTETDIATTTAVRGGINLIADLTSKDANSYVSYEMAADYFYERLNSDRWFDSSTYEQGQALLEAVRRLEGYRYHGDVIHWKQRLLWPRAPYSRLYSGNANSGTTTTIVDSSFSDDSSYEDDEFVNWGIRIMDGTNKHQLREVTAFDVSTGTITVSPAFTSAIDSTSDFWLIEEIPKEIRDAQCELALWIMEQADARNTDLDPNVASERIGDYAVTYRDNVTTELVPVFVRNLVDEYISRIGQMINSRSL